MEAVMGFCLLLVLMTIGVPIAFAFAGMTYFLTIMYDIEISTLMTTGFWSINSIILLALPLFIMAGYLMQRGGLANKLVDFVLAYVGHVRGGLGSSMVITSSIFGALSGTATAAVASIGTLMIPPMETKGYPREYSTALVSISSVIGLLIPPSITMILYAVVTRQSVAACFLSTVIPGILLMMLLVALNTYLAGKMPNIHTTKALPFVEGVKFKARATYKAAPALFLPFIILGGIYGGVFTPTEAAAVALVYAVPVGFFIYKGLTLRGYASAIVEAAATTGSVMLILLFSFVASRVLTMEGVPQDLAEWLLNTFQNKYGVLLAVNLLLIVLGMLIDDVSVTAILSPLLLPAMVEIGVHPVHFAAIVGTNVIIGANSPPVAFILFVACRIGKVEMHDVVKHIVIFIVFAAVPVMLITTYVPAFALWLPKYLGYL